MTSHEIEDRYPPTPLQHGMLYHALAEPGRGVDIEQMVCTLREAVDAARLRAAWESAAARHAILRTAFRWDAAPEQIVAARVELPWSEEDLSHLTPPARGAALAAYLRSDRRAGFAMDRAPLLRLRLFRFGAADCRLVWTFHHALLDGRSFPIVLREVFAIYDGAPLGSPPPAFRGFVEWLQTRDSTTSEAFWRQTLAGFDAPTPIPIEGLGDCASAPEQGEADALISIEDTRRLRTLAEANGLTLNTLTQGAWAILLNRYSGESDVVFGATRAGRHGSVEGADRIVGLLINTLPVRARIDSSAPLLPWLRELRAQWIAMRPHEHTPLAAIQALSDAPAGRPLFDSIVVFENYDLNTALRAQGGAWSDREFELHEQTNFALTLAAYAGDRLRLRIEFDRSRFSSESISRLLGHLTTLLRSIAENPQRAIGDLPLLPAGEERLLTHEWTQRSEADAPATTLHQLFAEQASRTPDAIAVSCEEAQFTYAELDRRAARLAQHLRTLGAGPEVIVGLCLERSADLITGVLGILKSGGAYLPIDLAYPPERLAFMLEDAQAPVVVTQRSLVPRLPAHGARVVCIDDFNSTGELHDAGTPDSLAYVIYTSGSTGQPKGCCVTHRNVVRLMAATHPWFGFDARDVWTLFHSIAFDFSVWELWGALLYGGRLVVVPHAVSRSPEAFMELLRRERVTVLNQTPSAFRQLIAADDGSLALALRFVIFGGEALEMRSLRPWFTRRGDLQPRLVNMYGITETTVHVTYRPLSAADAQRGSVIGVPIPDLEVLILDRMMRPVPIGVAGEMFVGGAGLARGYLRRPELTAQRFIPHPWRAGERLYRTGDLARWLPGRDIEYLGRIDQQVKIRGFRIELGEIESVLLQHAAVREAVAAVRSEPSGEKRLVAYLVPAQDNVPGSHELRAFLKTKLPDYMVPAAFVAIERVPLTANGKIDLRALPEPDAARPETGSAFLAPRTAAEETLAAIWQRVLRLDRVGVNDNFFDLGGDSILSILVVAQARQSGIALSPKLLFQHPTIAELASAAPASPAARAQEPREGAIPLTPVQHWFFEHDFAAANHWNQALRLKLPAPIPAPVLERAVRTVAEHHGVFRLRFARDDRGWHQATGAAPAIECATQSLAADALAHASLDIATGPLLRVVQSLEPEPRLLIVAHHLVCDGVSLRILLEDLAAALAGRALAERTTSFGRWAQLLVQAADAPTLRAELPHWHAIAATGDPPLPLDFPNGENTEASARTARIAFTREETDVLLRRSPGSSAHDRLIAAAVIALAQWTGRAAVLVDLEGHGREEEFVAELTGESADLSRTAGWFTSIFPARLAVPDASADPAAAVAAQLRAIPRRGFGYGLLRHLAGVAPRSHADVLFNFLGRFDLPDAASCFTLDGFSTDGWHSPSARRTHVLEINCIVIDGCLEARWTFSANLHHEESIARLAEGFRAALRRMGPTGQTLALSPIQQLYFAHEIAHRGAGFDQWHATLRGPLDPARFRTAWKAVLDRHAVLRTSFIADPCEPRQRVHGSLDPGWIEEDWRDSARESLDSRLAEFLRTDRARRFDLAAPPLTRIAILRIGDGEWRFVWSHHHLQIDGWSWPIVLREAAAIYRGETLGPAPDYADYLAWLGQHADGRSLAFWRAQMRSLREITPLPVDAPAAPAPATIEVTATLDPSCTEALTRWARAARVTLSAAVQAAWALLLSRRTGRRDVVFGASFSGRPAELPGIENMVGPMVNNLPVRAQIEPGERFDALAGRLHAQAFELQEHQFTPLADIHGASELPWHSRLFDTLLVVQTYVIDESLHRLGATTELTDLVTPVRTNYPLTLVVTPGAATTFTLVAAPSALDAASAKAVLGWLREILVAASFNDGCSCGDALAEVPARTAPSAARLRERSADFVAPRTELERRIASVWRAAFGADEVGVRDNFFDLGGHSLLMVRVHARLREVLGRDISLVRMFQHPTIESLARHLDGDDTSASRVTAAQQRAARQRAALGRRS